jgi:hypothetical protein
MIARECLPNRRSCETWEFSHAGQQFRLSISRFLDNRVAEIFITARHIGSPLEAIARDCAIAVSIALQFGADLATLRAALTRDHDGGPATLLGAALDTIAGEEYAERGGPGGEADREQAGRGGAP